MYGWIWNRLPGGPAVRLAVALLLAVAALALLWFLVFPWASLHLPLDQSSVGG